MEQLIAQVGILTVIAAGLIALFGQWIKSHEKWDTRLAIVGMIVLAYAVYAFRFGVPLDWSWDGLDAWLGKGWPWVTGIIATASTVGAFVPWFRTDSRKIDQGGNP